MPATTEYVALVSPSRYLVGLKALFAGLDDIPGCNPVMNIFGKVPLAVANDKALWPKGTAFLAILTRGARRPSADVRGTTAGEEAGVATITVIVRDDTDSTILDTLDAAEVAVVNAIRKLTAETRSEQELWDPETMRLTPVAAPTEGAVLPYAGTEIAISLWSFE